MGLVLFFCLNWLLENSELKLWSISNREFIRPYKMDSSYFYISFNPSFHTFFLHLVALKAFPKSPQIFFVRKRVVCE